MVKHAPVQCTNKNAVSLPLLCVPVRMAMVVPVQSITMAKLSDDNPKLPVITCTKEEVILVKSAPVHYQQQVTLATHASVYSWA